MEGAVIHAVLAIEMIPVGGNVRVQLRRVHIADLEEHGRGLHLMQLLIAHFVGHAAPGSHVAVARAVDENASLDALHPCLGGHLHRRQRIAAQDGPQKLRVIQHLHARLRQQLVHHQLQTLRLIGRYMVVSHRDPRGIGRARPHLRGMQRTALRYHAIDDLREQAADNHPFALAVIAGHERPHQSLRSHAAAGAALLHQYRLRARPGSGNRRAHARRTAAQYHHVRRESRLFCHCSCPPNACFKHHTKVFFRCQV